MVWHNRGDQVFYSPKYNIKETSYIDWTNRPADRELLAELLRHFPVIVQVDYTPATTEVNSHFVLAIRYIPDKDGGLNDDLAVIDPMTGQTSVLTYFNPHWLNNWMKQNSVTKVERTLVGARVFDIGGLFS